MADLILERVRDTLMKSGMVKTHAEFCTHWLGRSESYMRTLRFNGLQPSAAALATLSSKLSYYAVQLDKRSDVTSTHWARVLDELHEATHQALYEQGQQRWTDIYAQ